jgi:hypothetical protein
MGTSVFAEISNNTHKTDIGKTSEEKGEGAAILFIIDQSAMWGSNSDHAAPNRL